MHQLPAPEEIFNEIEFCKRTALTTAVKKNANFKCKINPYTSNVDSKLRTRKKSHDIKSKAKKFNIPDLSNIKLNDYTGKLKQNIKNETSSFVEIRNANGKCIIVKKSSLCWLLRNESRKLSSDRLLRVRSCNKKTKCKQIKLIAYKTGPKKKLFSSNTVLKPKRIRNKNIHSVKSNK